MLDDEIIEILDENIPVDLAKAYQKSEWGQTGVHKNYNQQAEVGIPRARRSVRLDYANAEYEPLTKEQAKEYLGLSITPTGRAKRAYTKEAFNERLCKLRFIVEGAVVEFESFRDYKDNVAIRRAPNRISYDTLRAAGHQEGFSWGDNYLTSRSHITYADIIIIIDCSSKIYKTDEYDKDISQTRPDIIQRRNDNNKELKVKSIHGIESPDYDPHHLYSKHFGGLDNTKISKSVSDTGRHVWDKSLGGNFESYLNNSNFREFKDFTINKENLYIEYDQVRRYLKKLERDRNEYDEQEYTELKDKYTKRKDDLKKEYDNVSKQLKDTKQKLLIQLSEFDVKSNSVLENYLKASETLSNRIYELKERLKQESSKLSITNFNAYEFNNDLKELEATVNKLKKDIEENKEAVYQVEDQSEGEVLEYTDPQECLNAIETNTDLLLKDYGEKRTENFKKWKESIIKIKNELKAVEDEILQIHMINMTKYANVKDGKEPSARQKEVAKKLANTKNSITGPRELDPALSNVLDFVDF